MKVFITTYGSRGDVQPYVALGKRLLDSGHDVTLATSSRFQDFVCDHGLKYGYMNDRLLAIVDTDQGRELLENTNGVFAVVRRTLSMLKQVGPLQESLLEECWNAARQCRPDCILFHPKAYGGPHYAEKLDVPVVLALPFPMFVPTGECPMIGFPNLRLGAWFNRMTYRAVNRLMALSAGKHVRRWRAQHGLRKQRRFDMLHATDGREIPVLHAYSRLVLPQPSDWPESATTTGYWFMDESKHGPPPSEIESFLSAGDTPVYVGFGSMAGRDPERLTEIVVKALQKANVRGILVTGWGGLVRRELPDSILCV
ncbi:MAG: glycosyltransferase family 1 protein, partial [Planctomycetales bacterium]|nr:glycosyltransferase family 1 protein [Planctomycetales bacterium]